MSITYKNDTVKVTETIEGKEVTTQYTQEEYKAYAIENIFKRIDEYHSMTYLSEEVTEDGLAGFPIEELGWKEIARSEPLYDESFPAWQDSIQTITYTDDNYTYVMNQVYCADGHVSPMHMGSILRLDKFVKEEI